MQFLCSLFSVFTLLFLNIDYDDDNDKNDKIGVNILPSKNYFIVRSVYSSIYSIETNIMSMNNDNNNDGREIRLWSFYNENSSHRKDYY